MKPRSLFLLVLASAALIGVAGRVAAEDKLYTVVDGYKVDPKTLQGFRTWRQAALTAATAPIKKDWSVHRSSTV